MSNQLKEQRILARFIDPKQRRFKTARVMLHRQIMSSPLRIKIMAILFLMYHAGERPYTIAMVSYLLKLNQERLLRTFLRWEFALRDMPPSSCAYFNRLFRDMEELC